MTSDLTARVDPTLPISAIIAEAYAVFDAQPPETLGVCTACCMYPSTERAMLKSKSADLTLRQIWEWYNSALVRSGPVSKSVWVFLLPRVLEILAANEDPHNGLGPIGTFDRFPTGDRSQWTDREWKVISRFQVALIDLAQTPEVLTCDTLVGYIEGFLAGGFALEPMVAQLKSWPKEVLITRLHSDWRHCDSIYWWSEFANAILNRFGSDDFLDPLLEYAFSEPDQENRDRAIKVCDLILNHAQRHA